MDQKKIRAIFLLGKQFVWHFLSLPFRQKRGLLAYKGQYESEGLTALTSSERSSFGGFAACVQCRLCDYYCNQTKGENFFWGPSYVIGCVSRQLVTEKSIEKLFFDCSRCISLDCEKHCPEGVPIASLIQNRIKRSGFYAN